MFGPKGAFLPSPCQQPWYISLCSVALFVVIAVLPVALMVGMSFFPDGSFNLARYGVLADSRTLSMLFKSLTMAGGAALFSLPVGLLLAVCVAQSRYSWGRLIAWLYLIPLFIPPHIHGLAWSFLLGERGLLYGGGEPLSTLYSLPGATIILGFSYYPILMIAALMGLMQLDNRLLEAGRLQRAPYAVWLRLGVPLLFPYLLSGTVFVFIFSFFNYGVPSMLRVPSYPVEMFTLFSAYYDEPGAVALAAPLILLALVLLLWQKGVMNNRAYVSISGRSRPLLADKRRPLQPWALLAACLCWIVTVALPLFALVVKSEGLAGLTAAWRTSGSDLVTSLTASGLAATLATIIAYFLAVYLHELRGRLHDALTFLTLLPFAFPATLFGIGLIRLWNRPATTFVYTGLAILVVAYVARFIPLCIRILSANLEQMRPAMREAAYLCRGGRLAPLLRIELPLAAKGLRLCWVVVFFFSMGELGATLLVVPPGVGTVSLKIYTLMHYGAGPLVAALALIVIGANLAVSTIIFAGARPR